MNDYAGNRQRRVEELFAAATERDDPAARDAFLVDACRGDADLLAEVRALVSAQERRGGFLTGASLSGPPTSLVSFGPGSDGGTGSDAADVSPGTVLGGRYELVSQIGKGGFGTVFDAVDRQFVGGGKNAKVVAVKVLHAGLNSKAVLARFDAEKQALAVMDHPNVAKVLDAGRAPGGQPYFVMELVKGVPITAYCDEHRLDARARLALVAQVCSAVQHAHQKGIIHRDLKPSNILVARYDEVAVPKVIDFGIAKATAEPLVPDSAVTAFDRIVGTLAYMSPEQASFNALDVDTRTDVYALGAVLYELLTGSTPLAEYLTKKAALDAWLKAIKSTEPVRPSARMSTTAADARASAAAVRGAEPAALGKALRGDVDAIVMHALAKDRNRRYPTAAALANDVERHLRGDTIEAREPTLRYRAGVFLRKHRGPVAAAAAAVVLLVGGVVGTSVGLAREKVAREDEVRQRQAADAARAAEAAARVESDRRRGQAERASRRSLAYSEVIRESMGLGNPMKIVGKPRTVDELAEVIAAGLDAPATAAALPADVRGPLNIFVAQALLGRPEMVARARGYADRGLEIARREFDPGTPEMLDALLIAARARALTSDAAGARSLLAEVDGLLAAHPGLAERSQATDVPGARAYLAMMLAANEKDHRAFARHAEALVAAYEVSAGSKSTDRLIAARLMLAVAKMSTNEPAAARGIAAATAAEAERALGTGHGLTLVCSVIRDLIAVDGDPAGAEARLAALVQPVEAQFGAENVYAGLVHAALGLACQAQGKADSAARHYARARSIAAATASSSGAGLLGTHDMLRSLTAAAGDRDAFAAIWARMDAAAANRAEGLDSQKMILTVFRALPLAQKNDAAGVCKTLEPLADTPIPPLDKLNESQLAAVLMYRSMLWAAYAESERGAVADEASRLMLEDARRAFGGESQKFATFVLVRWHVLAMSLGRHQDALDLVDAELTNRPAVRDLPDVRPQFATMRGISLAVCKRPDEAEPLLDEALAAASRNPMMNMFPETRTMLAGPLAMIRWARGDEAGAEALIGKYKLDRTKLDLPARPLTRPADAATRPATAPATRRS